MEYKLIALKQNKKNCFFITLFLLSVIGLGFYWNYTMNYEMIVKFTQLDESDPSFPFGERKIDARSWIKNGYKKIDDYQIYNPNPIPLEKNFKLAGTISREADMFKNNYPELYAYFQQKGSFDNFLKKNITAEYIGSHFNEYSNQPTNDNFLITFDDYQINITRKLENGSIYLSAYDLKKISSSRHNKSY